MAYTTSLKGRFFYGVFIMKRESVVIPSKELAQNGAFSYGAAIARQLENEDLNRSGRVMVKRVDALIAALGLPFIVPLNARAVSHDNGNAFAQVYANGNEFFVMARDLIEGGTINSIVNGKAIDIDLITGICLFSADSVQAIGNSGTQFSVTSPREEISEPIHTIQVSDQLSVYEVEAIVRLSLFINAITQDNPQVRNVYLNNPKVEYYLYILDAVEKGFISKELAKEWFLKVDARNKRLFDLVEKRIRKPDIAVSPNMPLEPIEEFVKEQIALGNALQLKEAIELLAASSPLWADILSIQRPQNWNDLNFLSYAYAYLQAGESFYDNPHVLVAVENPTESKIFALTKKIIAAMKKNSRKKYNIVGLYPHEKALPKGENAKKTMYYVPSPNGAGLQTARVIFESYRKGK